MAKHVIVDGFNVIRFDPELAAIEAYNFYGAQERLISRLAHYRRGTTHKVTVVFDGGGGEHAFRQKSSKNGIGIIYSARGETADEVIEDLIASAPGWRSGFLIITADRRLKETCRQYHVTVLSPQELLQRSRTLPLTPDADAWHGKKETPGWVGHTRKKGNPQRQPKKRRQSRQLW